MKDEPESLDADVLGMLRSALPMTAVSEEARARILSTVEGRILALPVRPPSMAPAATATGPAAWVAAHPWLALSVAFVLGTATGAAILRPSPSTSTPASTVTPTATAAPTATPPLPATPTETPASSLESVPVETLPSVKPVAAPLAEAPPVETGERLAAESAVLDIARAAIAAGDGERALQAVDRHAAAFPHGLLTEEREALGVRALSIAGRAEEARARAARFRARYPESLFLPGIEAATKGAR